MINYYQPYLYPFLKFTKTRIPDGVRRFFYHSFEDALWDLLKNKNIPRGSLFLIPDFYCTDVLDNIRLHGYKCVFYPLDKDFRIKASIFSETVKKYRPDVVVVFHACGITSDLMTELSWTKELKEMSLIVEDCVHRIVNPAELKFISDSHFIIDSLRKISPLYGSCMYGTAEGMSFTPTRFKLMSSYLVKSLFFYVLFRLALEIGNLVKSKDVVSKAHTVLLKRHDDTIGDSMAPHGGISLITKLSDRINFAKVKKMKSLQVKLYEKHLEKIFKNPLFYKIRLTEKDYGLLHVYPLGYAGKPDPRLEDFLFKSGIVVWFKFPDSRWSRDKGVLFLPVGFHMTEKSIIRIADCLSAFSSE